MANAESPETRECETSAAMASAGQRQPGHTRRAPVSRAPAPQALAQTNGRLDLKALRMAVHGWWLGNPLVYKSGVADLVAVARELAAAGAASGTIVISDSPASTVPPLASHPLEIEAVLILRPPLPLPHTALGEAALHAVAETAQSVLGLDADFPSSCAIRWPSEVVLSLPGDQSTVRLCSVDVQEQTDVAYVGLWLALDHLRIVGMAGRDDEEWLARQIALFVRPDWREVFLARVLHALERYLKEPPYPRGEPSA